MSRSLRKMVKNSEPSRAIQVLCAWAWSFHPQRVRRRCWTLPCRRLSQNLRPESWNPSQCLDTTKLLVEKNEKEKKKKEKEKKRSSPMELGAFESLWLSINPMLSSAQLPDTILKRTTCSEPKGPLSPFPSKNISSPEVLRCLWHHICKELHLNATLRDTSNGHIKKHHGIAGIRGSRLHFCLIQKELFIFQNKRNNSRALLWWKKKKKSGEKVEGSLWILVKNILLHGSSNTRA